MAQLLIDFEWWRDPSGYRLSKAKVAQQLVYHPPMHRELPDLPVLDGQWGLACHPLGIRVLRGPTHQTASRFRVVRQGDELQPYRPLDVFNALYTEFAKVRMEDHVLYFIERYGPLTKECLDPRTGELVDGVLAHTDAMRDLLVYSRADRRDFARFMATAQSNPFSELEVTLATDAAGETIKLRLAPTSLLDALWLQAAQALSSGATIRQCQHCNVWFETGVGTGRRLDSKFCSDEHRIAFNSHKRTAGRGYA